MHKLQTNKGARYMMIAFIVLFLTMLLRIFYIQAVGVVHNVNVKDLANEQQNK
ncbi:peptidoglycan D,D-transpeptidase FtsI family protein, partial [Bacillus cereus]